jgi:hypothetical protein
MNSRRGFFKSLALIAAGAAVAPGIFVPKLEPVKCHSCWNGIGQTTSGQVILLQSQDRPAGLVTRAGHFYALHPTTGPGSHRGPVEYVRCVPGPGARDQPNHPAPGLEMDDSTQHRVVRWGSVLPADFPVYHWGTVHFLRFVEHPYSFL